MNRPQYFEASPMAPRRPGPRAYASFGDPFRLVWRNLGLMILMLAAALLLGFLYLFLTPATYRAEAQLLLDPKLPQIFREASDMGLNVDTGQIETHMVAIRSRTIALAVVKRLELWKDPHFQRRPSLLSRVTGGKLATVDPQQTAADIFLDNLAVEREGISQVFNVAYSSRDRQKAAAIANETTRAYMQYLIDVRADAARSASDWLEQRLEQLRLQMNAAAKRAQNFRATDEKSASLEELQLSAETYRKVYQDFYSAFTEAVQRESYPVSTVRVISEATVPEGPSSPRPLLVLALSTVLGLAAGLLLAILRESRAAPQPRETAP